jgi:VanZ family protein
LQAHRFTYYWLPVIVYCTAIFVQSSFPTARQLPQWPYLDKTLHVAAYALLGFLVFRALSTGRLASNPTMSFIISTLFAGLYGLSDEFHQSFVPGRSPEATDVLADLIGGFCGAGIGWLRFKRIDKTTGLL